MDTAMLRHGLFSARRCSRTIPVDAKFAAMDCSRSLRVCEQRPFQASACLGAVEAFPSWRMRNLPCCARWSELNMDADCSWTRLV